MATLRVFAGERELSFAAAPPVVTEEELPLLLRASPGTTLVVPEKEAPGFFEEDADRAQASGSRCWLWHPFGGLAEEERRSWLRRLAYGSATLPLAVDGVARPLTVRVASSVLTMDQITAMNAAVARVALELVQSWRARATFGTVEKLRGFANSPDALHDQVLHVAERVLPHLSAAARRPYVQLGPGRPSARPVPRGVSTHSLDTVENRWLVGVATQLRKRAEYASQQADMASKRERHRAEVVVGASASDLAATKARSLEYEERRDAAPLSALRPAELRPGVTPRIARNGNYLAVYRAEAAVLRDAALSEAGSAAAQAHALASTVYEFWAVFTLFGLLLELGWTPANDPWSAAVSRDRYEVDLASGSEHVFERDGARLTLIYEPQLRFQLAPKRPAAMSTRERAMKAQAENTEPASPGLYTALSKGTPDFVIHLEQPDGRQKLVVGDMVFAPGDNTSTETIRALDAKAEKVHREYATKIWLVLPDGRRLTAVAHAGVVVAPASGDFQDRLDAKGVEVLLLNLIPPTPADGPIVSGQAAARAAFDAILGEASGEGNLPGDPCRVSPGPLRYGLAW